MLFIHKLLATIHGISIYKQRDEICYSGIIEKDKRDFLINL